MSAAELRKMDVNEVRALMHKLGLEVKEITEVNEGLTRLFENALEIEDVE